MRMNAIAHMRRSQFLRHNGVLFAGSVAVGALNYLYYPVLGRLLTPSTFGEVQTLVSLFLQLSVFLAVLSMVIVNIVANYTDEQKRNLFIFEFEKLALVISGALVIAAIVFGQQLQDWLNFEGPWSFAVLALALLFSVPFSLRGAYLRGQQRFGMVSVGNILGAGGKLLLSAALAVLGLGTIGAIGGVVLAQILACILVAYWAYRLGLKPLKDGRKFHSPDLRLLAPELRYGGVVLAASLAITLQYSIDIVVIKHYFDAQTAGLYAGVATVARIIFFLTASIAQVLLSKIRIKADARQNETVLNKSLLLLVATSLPVLLAMALFPAQIVGLLMGQAYAGMAGLLPQLSLSVFIVAILNLMAAYYLALRRYGIAVLTVVGAGFTYLFIMLNHGSPAAVVQSMLLGSAATLVSVGVWRLTERRRGAWVKD